MGYSGGETDEAREEIIHNRIDQLVSMLGQPIMGHLGNCRKDEGWGGGDLASKEVRLQIMEGILSL